MRRWIFLALLVAATLAHAEESLVTKKWTIGGVTREALVHVPAAATTSATPVIFAFHGHGGTARNAARQWAYHEKWPGAIVVYPQGLDTPGRTDPEGKKPGWQQKAGDQGDRDIAFVDSMLASLEKDYKVDDARVFATGHSNGGIFSYVLWSARGDRFTAFAVSSAPAGRNVLARPRPALQIAGEKDPIVSFASVERTMDMVRKLDGCDETPEAFGPGKLYRSKSGTPFVAWVHPDGHVFKEGAADLIVRFFREVAVPR